MTSPRHAEATALGRYYTHPVTQQRLISVTNVLSVGCAKPALVPWAAKIAAEYAIEHQGALMARSRTDRDGAIKDIKTQVTVARDKAADLGSAIHEAAEAHVLGRPAKWDTDITAEQVAPFLGQYEQFLRDFDVDLTRDIEASEMTVAHNEAGYAGTLDLLVWLNINADAETSRPFPCEPGERKLFLVDLKTSATRPAASVYGEYALQLAALRFARELWLPDGTVQRFNLPIAGCAVLNLRAKTYEFVPVPAWAAEREAFEGCLALAKWMHSTGKDISAGECRPVTPAGKVKPKRTRKAVA